MVSTLVWEILGKGFLVIVGFSIVTRVVTYVAFRRRPVDYSFLAGKIVLITGASSGLGQSLASEFYLAGSKVLIAARGVEKLKEFCAVLKSLPKKSNLDYLEPEFYYLDLENSSKIEDIANDILSKHGGRLDILINNAGRYSTTN